MISYPRYSYAHIVSRYIYCAVGFAAAASVPAYGAGADYICIAMAMVFFSRNMSVTVQDYIIVFLFGESFERIKIIYAARVPVQHKKFFARNFKFFFLVAPVKRKIAVAADI
jgi:hypothetical protein